MNINSDDNIDDVTTKHTGRVWVVLSFVHVNMDTREPQDGRPGSLGTLNASTPSKSRPVADF